MDYYKKKYTILERIKDEFEPRLEDQEAKETLYAVNWTQQYRQKTIYSSTNPDGFVRLFDCKPFNDQLRAYVYSDPTDTHILKVEIVGE